MRTTSHAETSSFAFLGSANARSEPVAARQGAKNFCYAKLKMPFRVFAFLLAFGQDLCGFRITRQVKGAGREQTEVIMSNSKLQERAVEAAARFIEHKDFELLETLAANTLIECGGGQVVVADGQVLALVELPIAGLMSPLDAPTMSKQVYALEKAWEEIGCTMPSPFMTMALIPLACLPELRLTNRGLVDCTTFQFVPLEV